MSSTSLLSPSKTKTFSVTLTFPPKEDSPIQWKNRLCWVYRNDGGKSFFWPALYYHDWGEAAQYCSDEMSTEQKIDFCIKVYESYDSPSSKAVVKLLGLDTLELLEINFHNDFCGEFWGWFPQVMTKQTKPSIFEQNVEWYLSFMKAVDQGMSLVKGYKCDKMYRLGKQNVITPHSAIQEFSREASHTEVPKKSVTIDVCCQQTPLQRPTIGCVTSPSSSQNTPTHSNRASPNAKETPRQLFLMKSKKRPSEFQTKRIKSTSNLSRKSLVHRVTPGRSSSRPKRKPRHDVFVPLSTLTQSSLKYTDEYEFYAFKNLIPLLTHQLGWKYRKANNSLRTWVYERVETEGENGGEYLEDFFYEEEEVVEYCRRNDYKTKYECLLNDNDDDNDNGNDICITPSPPKRIREVELELD